MVPLQATEDTQPADAAGDLTGDSAGDLTENAALTVENLADAPERSLIDAAEASARKGVPLRIRTALQLFNPELPVNGAYRGWRGQAWTVATKGASEARKVRQAIDLLFDLIADGGIDRVIAHLNTFRLD